ncbi:hypothetical protein EV561_102731 [Rhizobium sp. BK376]|nr:hypothetical protein EV561_102731 [Rhizobium sp. BK376]
MVPGQHRRAKTYFGCHRSYSSALLLKQPGQPVNEGRHLRPLADAHFLTDFKQADWADENILSPLDEFNRSRRKTRIAR